MLVLSSKTYSSKTSFSYSTSNGMSRTEVGGVGPGGGYAVTGSYQFRGTDGATYRVSFTADQRGYRPRWGGARTGGNSLLIQMTRMKCVHSNLPLATTSISPLCICSTRCPINCRNVSPGNMKEAWVLLTVIGHNLLVTQLSLPRMMGF